MQWRHLGSRPRHPGSGRGDWPCVGPGMADQLCDCDPSTRLPVRLAESTEYMEMLPATNLFRSRLFADFVAPLFSTPS